MLAPVRTADPTSLPVDIAAAKAQCQVEHDDDNALLEGLIQAATSHLDGYTGILGRALVTQTWRQDFPAFCSTLRLPLRPIASVSLVTYYDGENVQRTLASSVYTLRLDAAGYCLGLKPAQSWPGAYRRDDAISVTFVAGTTPAAVPAAIRQALLMLVGHWYANREPVVIGGAGTELPMAVQALLAPFRSVKL